MKNKTLFYALLSMSSVAVVLLLDSFFVVNPGETAIQIRVGRIVDDFADTGVHVKMPFVDTVNYIDRKVNKTSIETTALTKDLQFVTIGIAINYRIVNAKELFCSVSGSVENKLIDPFAQETIKSVVAQFNAESLIQHRHEARQKVLSELKERLEKVHIDIMDFNFVHLDFSREFIKSVEEKQIAMQQAITAKNLTKKVEEEAVQQKRRADAEVYALQQKKAVITKELVDLKKIEGLFDAIKKWDGKLPRFMSSASSLLFSEGA